MPFCDVLSHVCVEMPVGSDTPAKLPAFGTFTRYCFILAMLGLGPVRLDWVFKEHTVGDV